jgi:xylulokinase
MRIQTFCHAVPGTWHLMGCVLSAAGSLRWYRDTFAPGKSYDAITAGAATAPPGCEGLQFLPYLTGERTPYPDPDARGVFFGATLRSEADWFARAVLEGVAYAMKDSFTLLDGLNVPVSEVRITGGGAKSAFWRQILADVVGYPHLTLAVDEGPAVGAALLAAVGTGTYSSVPEACEATIRTVRETRPTPDGVATYLPYYTLYRSLYPALKNAFTTVANLQ